MNFSSLISIHPVPIQPSNHTSASDNISTLKGILLFVVTFFFSLIAFLIREIILYHKNRNQQLHLSFNTFFAILSCFGGGVFLATCLLDLLPDSRYFIKEAS